MIRLVLIILTLAVVVTSSPTRIRITKGKHAQLIAIAKAFDLNIDVSRITPPQIQRLEQVQSYCSCVCCQESVPKTGFVEACNASTSLELPAGFQCPAQFCALHTPSSCPQWNSEKCDGACYCQRCSETNPSRCSVKHAILQPGPVCSCPTSEHAPACDAPSLVPASSPSLQCFLSCICDVCNLRDMKKRVPTISSFCNNRPRTGGQNASCSCHACPSKQSILRTERLMKLIQ